MSNNLSLSKSIDSFYLNEVDKISTDPKRDNIFSYSGKIEEEMVYDSGVEIENYLKDLGEKKSTIRRVFFMFTESIQNVRKHGLKDDDGSVSGAYIVESLEDGYILSFISGVKKMYTPAFFGMIDFVNSLSKEDLKAHYRKILDNGEMSDKGGAGLGLITLGMKCTGPLTYASKDYLDDTSIVKLSFDLTQS